MVPCAECGWRYAASLVATRSIPVGWTLSRCRVPAVEHLPARAQGQPIIHSFEELAGEP